MEPSLGYKQAGFVPGAQFLGDYVNWYFFNNYEWIQYLDALHTEVQFLNKAYVFTNTLQCTGFTCTTLAASTIATTGNCTFGDTTGDSVAVTGTLTANVATVQGTITSTAGVLRTLAGNVISSADVQAGGDFIYGSPPGRLKFLPLTSFTDANGTATRRWLVAAKESAVDGSDNFNLNVVSPNTYDVVCEIKLPHGSTLTGVTASTHQSAAGSTAPTNMVMRVMRVVYAASGAPTTTVLGTDTHINSAGNDTLAVTGLSNVVDSTAETYLVRFTSSDAGGADTDTIYYALVAFTDPGPRNH